MRLGLICMNHNILEYMYLFCLFTITLNTYITVIKLISFTVVLFIFITNSTTITTTTKLRGKQFDIARIQCIKAKYMGRKTYSHILSKNKPRQASFFVYRINEWNCVRLTFYSNIITHSLCHVTNFATFLIPFILSQI